MTSLYTRTSAAYLCIIYKVWWTVVFTFTFTPGFIPILKFAARPLVVLADAFARCFIVKWNMSDLRSNAYTIIIADPRYRSNACLDCFVYYKNRSKMLYSYFRQHRNLSPFVVTSLFLIILLKSFLNSLTKYSFFFIKS